MQGAMEGVGERALVTPQVGKHDDRGFEHAARLEHRVAQVEPGFLVFDVPQILFASTR